MKGETIIKLKELTKIFPNVKDFNNLNIFIFEGSSWFTNTKFNKLTNVKSPVI